MWDAFLKVFLEPNFGYIAEAVALFVLIYFVCRVLVENGAEKLIGIYIFILSLTALFSFFIPKEVAPWVFLLTLVLVSFFMLLLFSMEIKRGIWANQQGTQPVNADKTDANRRTETEACIDAIIHACQNMSKNDIGALIVLSNGNLPKSILKSGTYINADISQQLIEGIFFPKSPLHDGALIVEEHKLLAAGCFLPLAQNNEKYSKDLGTRHRAGIGITEVTNVVSIIVSEETGIISIVKQGKITRYADYNMLRKALREYYWKDFDQNDHKRKSHGLLNR